jgi:hypothetical protein
MWRSLLATAVVLVVVLAARPSPALEIRDAVMTTAVVEREPVDEVSALPIQGGELFCFTRVVGADRPSVVYHLWYRGERLVSRVELPVNSPSWRTWSMRRFGDAQDTASGAVADGDEGPGDWRVEIRGADGALLETLRFVLK